MFRQVHLLLNVSFFTFAYDMLMSVILKCFCAHVLLAYKFTFFLFLCLYSY